MPLCRAGARGTTPGAGVLPVNARNSRRFCLASRGTAAIVPRTMSQHSSLKGQGAIKAKRNVLKRFERVEVLKKRGQFKEGQSVIGLKKTKPDD
jgi:small basic protein (TIGR04137 family)